MEKSDDCEDEGVRVGLDESTGGEDLGLVERGEVDGVYACDL